MAAKLDLGKQKELDEKVEERIIKKKEQKKIVAGMRDREKELATLSLSVQVSADGATQEATVKELQAGARQHMIIVAGPRKACRDALVGGTCLSVCLVSYYYVTNIQSSPYRYITANLLKMDFAMSNVLVVPYELEGEKAEIRPEGGFGERPIYETQTYVARPAGEGWEEYIDSEMKDAVEQNGSKAKDEGIVIVVSSTGNVIRRGIGKVPWRQMVEQLDETVGGGPQKEAPLFG